MNTLTTQRGVGLMEVLVALLILMVGVLGFIALQYRAVEATAEGGARVQAINLARDFAERIRVNRGALTKYEAEISDPAKQESSSKNCVAIDCTAEEMADFDVAQIVKRAKSFAMAVNLLTCPGNEVGDKRKCIYVAWGDTAPTNGVTSGGGDCTVATAYESSSTCLIMEVY